MKKILTVLVMLFFVSASLAIAFAQPRQRKRNLNVNRGVTRSGNQQRSVVGAGAGAGSVYRTSNRRGRYVTRNGKRIWVPQGSPAVGNRRGVYEREQEAELKKRSTNTNRP